MSPSLTILALVSYPLLSILPINPIRFRWGGEKAATPMPAELEARAEAADRAVFAVIGVCFITVVLLVFRASQLSYESIGLTTKNWIWPTVLGLAVGYFPSVFFAGSLTANNARNPESTGPLSVWISILLLSVFSAELWRVFCIRSLAEQGFSDWGGVVVTAVAYSARQFVTNSSRGMGSVLAGIVEGVLFVKTGSFFAPLMMALATAGVRLFQIRRNGLLEAACPTCGANFRLRFPLVCPRCSEVLKREPPGPIFSGVWFALSVYCLPIASYIYGFRDITSIVASIIVGLILWFFSFFTYWFFTEPKLGIKIKPGGGILRLTDRPFYLDRKIEPKSTEESKKD